MKRIQSLLSVIENGLLFSLVMGMLGLGITQVFLRNFFESGLVSAEAITRIMVLWATMLGSMIAVRSGQHLRIDLLDRYTHFKHKHIITGIIQLITACLCLLMAYFSLQFFMFEYEDGTLAFANIPNWLFISILPFSFLIMFIRYLIISINQFFTPN